MANAKQRAEAYNGDGYGGLRFMLYTSAKGRIEECIRLGYYRYEVVTIIESVIADRLESCLSYLKKRTRWFQKSRPCLPAGASGDSYTYRVGDRQLLRWRDQARMPPASPL